MAKLPYAGPSLDRLLSAQRGAVGKKTKAAPKSAVATEVARQLQLGASLQLKGNLGLAAEMYQSVLRKDPNQPDALHYMGTLAIIAGEIDAAIDLFARAVARKPGNPGFRLNFANALVMNEDPAAAEFHLRKALKVEPGNPALLCLLADCRALREDRLEAKNLYERVLAEFPNHPRALIGYGELCLTLGDFDTARSCFRKCLDLNEQPALALAGLAICSKPTRDSPEAADIQRFLKQPGLTPFEYSNLASAAGEIAERAEDYEEAFGYFSLAKRMGATPFDLDAHRKMFQTLKATFTPEFFEEHRHLGHPSNRPVFIVGMPRSGTTLTEQIIARHPDAAGAGELGDINRIASSLGFRRDNAHVFAKRLAKLSAAEAKACALDYLTVLDRTSASAARVTDKLPHNFQHIGLIVLLFPNAKIIHCRRDPRDNCLSCFTTRLKAHTHSYAADLATLGAYYREYDALMRHWKSLSPVPIHEMDYERLIEAPEDEVRRLLAFVGLPFDPACLTPHESARAVNTQSRMQVRQPMYRTSVDRWRRYEKYLGPLFQALGDLVPVPPSEQETPSH